MASPWDGMAAANLKRKGIYEPALAAAATLLAWQAGVLPGSTGQAAAKAPRQIGGWTGTQSRSAKNRRTKTATTYARKRSYKKPAASKVIKKKMKPHPTDKARKVFDQMRVRATAPGHLSKEFIHFDPNRTSSSVMQQ
jgi:hypothetical protein